VDGARRRERPRPPRRPAIRRGEILRRRMGRPPHGRPERPRIRASSSSPFPNIARRSGSATR
jgi:hypothetical protein